MLTIVEQTREERVAMYMRLKKRELIEMLINNQDALEAMQAHLEPPFKYGIDQTRNFQWRGEVWG